MFTVHRACRESKTDIQQMFSIVFAYADLQPLLHAAGVLFRALRYFFRICVRVTLTCCVVFDRELLGRDREYGARQCSFAMNIVFRAPRYSRRRLLKRIRVSLGRRLATLLDFFFFWGNVAEMAGADLGVQMPSASGYDWLPHVFLFVAFFLFTCNLCLRIRGGADGVAFDELRICKNI